MEGVIYKIKNLINGKIYIGQTGNKYPNTRWSAHKLNYKHKKNHPLYNSMNKYGVENFTFEIIERDIDIKNLSEKEIDYIKNLQCLYPFGYNLTTGGEAVRGESNPMFGKFGDKNPNYGNRWTDEQKQKARILKLGTPGLSGEKNPMYGKKAWNNGIKKTEKERDVDRLRQKNRVSVRMFKDNKLIKDFVSLGAASKWIRENTVHKKADSSTIRKSITNNWNCYGYKFNK